jgi:predicted nucleotidyltransferase
MLDSAEWFIAEFGSSGLSPFQRLWRWLYQRYVPDIHGIGTDYESGRKWKKVEESGRKWKKVEESGRKWNEPE